MERYICDECDATIDGDGRYAIAGQRYGTCDDCLKSRETGLIYTVARLEKVGPYAWPGGYPILFLDQDNSQLCLNCARNDLENGDGPIDYYVAQGDESVNGGVFCDGCGTAIVKPACPECGEDFEGEPRLFADNVDASMLCLRCAAKLVCGKTFEGGAVRLPGVGIRVTKGDTMHSPWYAPSGTIYRHPSA